MYLYSVQLGIISIFVSTYSNFLTMLCHTCVEGDVLQVELALNSDNDACCHCILVFTNDLSVSA